MTELSPLTIRGVAVQEPVRPVQGPAPQGFAAALGEAIGKVDALQLSGDAEAEKLGRGAGNLHETALALEKADVAMKLAVKVRNKLLDAYNEVMRMSV